MSRKKVRGLLSGLRRYSISIATVAAAVLLTWAVHPLRATPSALFLLTVLVSSWYGGPGPAALAAVLSLFSVDYFFIAPTHLIELDSSHIARAGAFGLILAVVIGFTEVRKRLERSLREQAERLRQQATVLDLAPVIVRDLDGRILQWNAGAEQMYGWRKEEAEGRVDHTLLRTEFPTPLAGIQADLTVKGVWEGELVQHRRDGTEIFVASHWTLHRSGDGERVRVLEVNTDITAEKRAEAELKQIDRRKDEFLAVLSHELRNPLGTLRSGLHMLGSGETEERRHVLEMMNRQLQKLIRLVDDLLDVARIGSGKIRLRRERLELASLVREAVEASRASIEASEHTLTTTLPHEPICLDGDRLRLAQVLSNLLENSAKFTARGGHIWLEAARESDCVVLRVVDDGIGIPADMLPRVFDMFTQVAHPGGRPHEGLGIGLSVVRRIVELHGGAIEASSAGPGKGSEFIVRLPLSASRPVLGGEPEPSRAPEPRLEPARRVLVVDDDGDSAEVLALVLKSMGYRTRTAQSGPEALQAAAVFRPHVTLLDIGLPGMSGYEVAQRMRGDPTLRDVALVAVTGWGQDSDRQRSEEAGFDHHLVKPVDPHRLHELLSSMELVRS